jgi:hypothetical protein
MDFKRNLINRIFGCAAGAAVMMAPALTRGQNAAVPNFAPDNLTGWLAQDDEFIQPPSGPGPVKSVPERPYISFYKNPNNKAPAFRVADLTNPILLPWTREALKRVNDRVHAGEIVAIPKERCWPTGVPTFLLYPATPVFFIQTRKQVTMIWQQDHQVRRVYLDVPHSKDVKPSWFGESVGHYEGDTLVVDTVGLTPKTYVDHYQTPHTEQLHVVERIRMIDNGRTLEVNVLVEDPGAFAMPWRAIQRYRRVQRGALTEMVCAENNGDHFHHNIEPMPTADKPDF